MSVREKGWYKQWRHTVLQNIEQACTWGAESVTLLGIKGDLEKNYATLHEWPTVLADVQQMLKESRVKGAAWDKVSEMRTSLKQLKGVLSLAGGTSFIIIASCPSEYYDAVKAMATDASEARNIFCAWGRVDDASGGVEAVEALSLEPKVTDAEVDAFCAKVGVRRDELGTLTRGEWEGKGLGAECKVIATLPALKVLILADNALGAHVKHLAALPALETLYLANNALGEHVKHLAAFPALDELDLANNDLGEHVKHLAALPALEWLNLANNALGAHVKHLAALPALKILDLANNHLGAHVKHLAALPALKKLFLADNDLGEHVKHLAALPALEILGLKNNDVDVERLTAPGAFPALKTLYINYKFHAQLAALTARGVRVR